MQFHSIHFIIFLIVVMFLYFNIKHKFRWILLLISSYYFYMSWKAEYIILIIISTLIDYLAAIGIEKYRSKKKIFIITSLCVNLGILFVFKYFNFVSDSVREILNLFTIQLPTPVLNVLLPIGISFYTFQTISYTIDVYRGKIKAEKHLGIFAVYVSFFPQLVAGPIERAKNLLPQFYEKHNFEYKRFTDGLKLVLWGFFKKVVIADRLAITANIIYNNVNDFSGTSLIIGTVFFAFQIYCDFSGYSDIAIGTAQMMGFRLMDNFKRPYSARSIVDFWRRWHISLSTWVRDYIYFPLGGSRCSTKRYVINILLTWSLMGLWHGAAWTFFLWGVFHAVFILIYRMTKKQWDRLPSIISIILTFIIVNIGWIFFRSNNLSDLIYVLTHLLHNLTLNIPSLNIGLGWAGFLYAVVLILFLELIHFMQSHVKMREFLSEKPVYIRWPIYILLIFLILFFGVFQQSQFIYFQF